MVTQVQTALRSSLLDFCHKEQPGRKFRWDGDNLVVDSIDVVEQKVEEAYSGGQGVSGHYRHKKGGGYTWVQPHVRQNTMPSALELAQLEEQQESSPTVGFSIDDILQKWMETVKKPNSLQRYLQ